MIVYFDIVVLRWPQSRVWFLDIPFGILRASPGMFGECILGQRIGDARCVVKSFDAVIFS